MGIDVFKLSCRELFSGDQNLVILTRRIFSVLQKFFKKNSFFGEFFEILQVFKPVLAKPYEELES
jgi:hypothetical protein